MTAEPIIRVEDFTTGYDGNVLMHDVNFAVDRGEVFVILGGSGCGKSTLLKHMVGLYEPMSGRIFIDGDDIVAAGGWALAQNCDLCVASTNAKFAITEVKVGRGSPWAAPLIHMIPQRIMMEIILTGKPITASRAYEIGLVNRLVEPAQLMDAAIELALEVLEGAPLSVKAGRETVMLATEMGRAAALMAGRATHEHAYKSEDAQEGPRAFVEKRAAVWQHR